MAKSKRKPEYLYRLLPSGNANEFPAMDANIVERGITAWYSEDKFIDPTRGSGRYYRILKSDESKLKWDEDFKEYYLPVKEDSGHSLYPSDDEYVKKCKRKWGMGKWKRVTLFTLMESKR